MPHFYSPSVQRQSCQNILSCTRPAQRRVHSLHDKVHIRIFEFIWVVITLHLHLERMGFPGSHEKHKTMLSYQFIAPMLWRREQHHSLFYSTCSKSVASRLAAEPGGVSANVFSHSLYLAICLSVSLSLNASKFSLKKIYFYIR